MFKKIIKYFIGIILVYKKYIKGNLNETPIAFLKEQANRDSANYINEHVSEVILFENHHKLWDYAISKIRINGLILEFGVYEGFSINYFANKLKKEKLYGFDSFHGLKEDWFGTHHISGMFNKNGVLPRVQQNVKLIPGWFENTLPDFLNKYESGISLVHIDIDTYPSTKYVLKNIVDRLKPGTIIIFDEYIGFPGWRFGEYKAWKEICHEYSISYKYIAFSNQQVAILIT